MSKCRVQIFIDTVRPHHNVFLVLYYIILYMELWVTHKKSPPWPARELDVDDSFLDTTVHFDMAPVIVIIFSDLAP
ncbi:hypothetical protein Pmani_030928 [Petrolisthes manimaculis]|uniref:Uncharacterized protein n=1 Tax=Petrolisthes manimaculis TaxID=1843537 RepID=A0AAE1NWY5_9EUCA|nr:hypothetical protein Pmani_030928 [Petrolisthes manimaculis]